MLAGSQPHAEVERERGTIRARVWVVEDDGLIRDSLRMSLAAEGYEVHSESDGLGVAEVLEQFRPDLAILDVRLPVGPNGYETARVIREKGDVPVLFLTAADALEDRLAGFHAGADDYLVKPFSMAELVLRAQALLRRAGRLSSVRMVGDLALDETTRVVTRAGQTLALTKTEYDLLAALIARPGHILSKHKLLAQVWRFEAYDLNLVEVHVCSLRRKLEVHGPRLLHTVWGVGYSLRA